MGGYVSTSGVEAFVGNVLFLEIERVLRIKKVQTFSQSASPSVRPEI